MHARIAEIAESTGMSNAEGGTISLWVALVGGLVMIAFPIGFVGSLLLATLRNSRRWGLVAGIFGILCLAGVILTLRFAAEETSRSEGAAEVILQMRWESRGEEPSRGRDG